MTNTLNDKGISLLRTDPFLAFLNHPFDRGNCPCTSSDDSSLPLFIFIKGNFFMFKGNTNGRKKQFNWRFY